MSASSRTRDDRSASAAAATPRQAVAAGLAILLLGFGLRTISLGAPSLWYDEGFSVVAARLPVVELLSTLSQDRNTPLHFLALSPWLALAGTSEFAARAFSALAGLVAVAGAGRIALAAGRKDGLLLALLFAALCPAAIALSREARAYSLLMGLSTLLVALTVALMRRQTSWRWAAWAILSVAGYATHVLGGVVWAAATGLLLLDLLSRRKRQVWSRAGAAAILISGGIIVAWSAFLLARVTYQGSFSGSVDTLNLLRDGMAANLLPRLEPRDLIIASALAATALLVISLGPRASRPIGLIIALYFLCEVGVGVITGKFVGRYATALAPALMAAVAVALISASRVTRHFLSGVVAVALTGSALFAFSTPRAANEDFRGAAAFLTERRTEDETVLLVSGHFAPVFAYYFGPTGWAAIPDAPLLDVRNALDYDSAAGPLNRALAGKRGAWLLRWQDEIIDPTGVARELLRRQSVAFGPDAIVEDFAGLSAWHFRFNDVWQPIPERLSIVPMQPTSDTGKQVGLMGDGCGQIRPTRVTDPYLEVACLWRVQPSARLPYNAQVSLRVSDASGRRVLQADQQLIGGGLPTIRYDKPILGLYLIPLPQGLAAGDYTFEAVPYIPGEEWAPRLALPLRFTP